MRPFGPILIVVAVGLGALACGDSTSATEDAANNAANNDIANNDVNNIADDVCVLACDRLIECLATEGGCDDALFERFFSSEDCRSSCREDPEDFQAEIIIELECVPIVDVLLENACEDTRVASLCPAGCDVSDQSLERVGEPCRQGERECDPASEGGRRGPRPFCIPEAFVVDDDLPPEETGFVGGYCSGVNCRADSECGTGNICLRSDDDNICMKGCASGKGRDVCREGYGCWPVGRESSSRGICLPECLSDDDCCDPEDGQNCAERCDDETGACIEL